MIPLGRRLSITLLIGTVSGLSTGPSVAAPEIDSHTFAGLRARSIGPAVMGGRISAMDAVHEERLTIYAGAASGGVWKSIDAGTTFKPIFDEYTQSIGAITIDPSDAKTIWVGTGETWTRNSVSVGDGMYKSTDGGENWEHIGLKDSERINKIIVDPKNGDTAYVCVTGHLWNANQERGVFKTSDGGKSWKKVLYVDEDTGCGSLAIDPQDSRILYAGMWQFRRWPYFFKSGGPGSGIYKSTDAGETWHEVTKGLPTTETGRSALAVAPSRPNRVYATVESENTKLYRSDDLGETWTQMGADSNVEGRPFYFSLLVVDPVDYTRVYKPGGSVSVTTDGGATFSVLAGGYHPDVHALWIDPNDPHHILIGTDGGVYESNDRGMHWSFLQVLPISQFYQISVDSEEPYNVYGGLQDNGTWMGPSQAAAGITDRHWRPIGSGDGFHAYADRGDPDVVYVEWQGGRIQRIRKSNGESKDIKPLPEAGDPELRFNWNTAMHLSPTREDTLYLGGQFLFRSRNRGDTWEKISPDLTTNDPEKQKQIESGGLTPDNSTAENHCSIFTIAESPLDENLVWVGTDDGHVQVTRNSGSSWSNATGQIPGLPTATWVSHVEASPHDKSTAFATFDGHRTGDMKPYVYKTTDLGRTWTSIATDGIDGYCHVIRQDPLNPNLLFLGTEFGLYISIDGGGIWARLEEDFPKVSVRAMVIHPRDHDLVLATHGRGVYIIDDLTPLRHLTADVLEEKAALLPNRPTIMRIPTSVQEFPGDDTFVGSNPSAGASITYYLKRRHMFGDLKVEVYDSEGNLVKAMPGSKRRGMNRISWFMREKPPKVPPASSLVPQFFSFVGPQVAEGEYTVKLIQGKSTYEGKIALVTDPRADYTPEGRAKQDALVTTLYQMLGRLTYVVDAVVDLQMQTSDRIAKLDDGDPAKVAAQAYADSLEAFRKTVVATRKGGFLAGEEQLREKLTDLYGAVNSYEGQPTDSQARYTKVLDQELRSAATELATLTGSPLDSLNRKLKGVSQDEIRAMTQEQWEAKQKD